MTKVNKKSQKVVLDSNFDSSSVFSFNSHAHSAHMLIYCNSYIV